MRVRLILIFLPFLAILAPRFGLPIVMRVMSGMHGLARDAWLYGIDTHDPILSSQVTRNHHSALKARAARTPPHDFI